MNQREKLMLAVVGSFLGLFIGVFMVRTILLRPVKELDNQIAALRERYSQLNGERRAYFTSEDYLKSLAPRMFGRDPDTATAVAGKMITDLILRLGLQDSQFSRAPVGPRRLRGAQEVGWSVQGEGPLPKMIDLLFVLEQTPQVHRVDNLVLSAGEQPGRLKARFRYLTLVVDINAPLPNTDLKPKFGLESPQRRFYDTIVERDLLRPYVPRSPGISAGAVADADPPARPELLKVVSLSDWGGIPEAHICDLGSMNTTRYRLGDSLCGGRMVMIDYRTRRMPGEPGVLSYSRIILQIGTNYWAVEDGQTLSTKHQLAPNELPKRLRGS